MTKLSGSNVDDCHSHTFDSLSGGKYIEKRIDMILHCPACGLQHIDAPAPMGETEGWGGAWTNPPHRSHLCHGCGHIWRPADVPTNGVAKIKTQGKNDSARTIERRVHVTAQGVQFGNCWISHALLLEGRGPLTARAYKKWLNLPE